MPAAPVPASDTPVWAARADAAEQAVVHRHVRRLWSIPSTRLGRVRWPADVPSGIFVPWHYSWQAHLIDCAVDATAREATPARRRRAGRLCRTPWMRNCVSRGGSLGWRRDSVDDMAWMALALQRAAALASARRPRAIEALTGALRDAVDRRLAAAESCGGFSAAGCGAAALVLARAGDDERAAALCDWIDSALRDRESGLIGDDGPARADPAVEEVFHAHSQAAVLGAEAELVLRGSPRVHGARVARLLAAVSDGLCSDGVLRGAGGGGPGLHAGILARYLALIACGLPDTVDNADIMRETAATLVMASASAAWKNRIEIDGEPLFGAEWDTPAVVPAALFRPDDPAARVAERYLSVQVSGWMLMEAAARVEAASGDYRASGTGS